MLKNPLESTLDPEPELQASELLVPPGRSGLFIRNGVPERFYPPGLHALPLDQAKVEVRLLTPATDAGHAPPDSRALALPFERSFLYLDGRLIGMVKRQLPQAHDGVTELQAWEGFQPARARQEPRLEQLLACVTEPLRACLPASGRCCGARLAA